MSRSEPTSRQAWPKLPYLTCPPQRSDMGVADETSVSSLNELVSGGVVPPLSEYPPPQQPLGSAARIHLALQCRCPQSASAYAGDLGVFCGTEAATGSRQPLK